MFIFRAKRGVLVRLTNFGHWYFLGEGAISFWCGFFQTNLTWFWSGDRNNCFYWKNLTLPEIIWWWKLHTSVLSCAYFYPPAPSCPVSMFKVYSLNWPLVRFNTRRQLLTFLIVESQVIRSWNVSKPYITRTWNTVQPFVIRTWNNVLKPFLQWAWTQTGRLLLYAGQVVAR